MSSICMCRYMREIHRERERERDRERESEGERERMCVCEREMCVVYVSNMYVFYICMRRFTLCLIHVYISIRHFFACGLV